MKLESFEIVKVGKAPRKYQELKFIVIPRHEGIRRRSSVIRIWSTKVMRSGW